MMLVTVDISNKNAYLFRLFNNLWKSCSVECQICFDRIIDDGLVIVSDYGTLNLEKMFHSSCWDRWFRVEKRGRDPFNRPIKYKFNFPPKSLNECEFMLKQIKGFIGEEDADKLFANEFDRVIHQRTLDVELDFARLLKVK
ncbi:ac53-like protein [Clanis bilineata nucleopolyhedrovirus]|uniref:Ac53-like protein n=1 Tax=Clanis bilineata nucleopolyhedrovirus TaxID=1307957 RepID=Q0N471_9ABAC|nr:ac53-like protein [Clanis bilineata nucleopolyhedrovirus]ABF47372.1 ac53-like protein [Clanis bilineata nucleopolyhedrovirus]